MSYKLRYKLSKKGQSYVEERTSTSKRHITAGIAGIFWLLRFRLEAIFVLLTSSSNLLKALVKRLIKRPRPTSQLVTVVRVINEPSFPSGHVMQYTNLFGL